MPEYSQDRFSAWRDSIVGALHPTSVLLVGDAMDGLRRAIEEQGIRAATFATESDELASGESDVVILPASEITALSALSEADFRERFGSPRAVVALIPLAESGPTLPEITAWLSRHGYARDLSEENWSGGTFFSAIYRQQEIPAADLVRSYEAEWWRLAQISQKRRQLLAEYMTEMIETTFRFESQLSQLNLSHQKLEGEIERQTEYAQSLQEELERQREYARSLQEEIQRQEQWAETQRQELEQQREWSEKLQQEVRRLEQWVRPQEQEIERHTQWAQTLQQELANREQAYNALLEEATSLRKIKAEWEAFQGSQMGKLWKNFRK